MSVDDIEEEHEYLISKLRKLKVISVPNNFENVLISRLKSRNENNRRLKNKITWGIIPILVILIGAVSLLLFNSTDIKYTDPSPAKLNPPASNPKYNGSGKIKYNEKSQKSINGSSNKNTWTIDPFIKTPGSALKKGSNIKGNKKILKNSSNIAKANKK